MEQSFPHRGKLRLGDSGQAMLEACIVIPVLLALFLGLWHHALLSQAQTRSILAARHVAWARATMNKRDADLPAYATPFFPAGTKINIKAERQTSTYAEYHNNLISYCATFTATTNDHQHKITLSAEVPALPFAPPQGPGQHDPHLLDFLTKATTKPVVVVRNFCGEQPHMTILTLLAFLTLRPDLIVEVLGQIALSEIFVKLIESIGSAFGQSGFFAQFMEKIGLSFLSDLFSSIGEALTWLITDLIELILSYTT